MSVTQSTLTGLAALVQDGLAVIHWSDALVYKFEVVSFQYPFRGTLKLYQEIFTWRIASTLNIELPYLPTRVSDVMDMELIRLF